MSDPAAPHEDTQGLRADSGDPNRDRADLGDQAPTQVDDDAIHEHLAELEEAQLENEDEHDAPTAAQ